MASLSAQQSANLSRRLSKIKHIVLVLSGKGGVGKSSVAVQLALSLLHSKPGAKVGLLDIDLTGPSIPRMLGLEGHGVHQSSDGWVPVYLEGLGEGEGDEERGSLKCMSIGFLLKNNRDSVVWRGPKKTAMIRQFLGDVRWGDLDWLVVDTPPGTSDEHISLLENLQPLLQTTSSLTPSLTLPSLHSILVSTPQAVSLTDVSKELSFARKTSLPVLGLIENMSGYVCPHCGDIVGVFGVGGGEEMCRQEEEKREKGEGEGLRFLGRVPIDRELVALMDSVPREMATVVTNGVVGGEGTTTNGTTPNGTTPNGTTQNGTSRSHVLVEKYAKTPTFPIFREICSKVVGLIEPTTSEDAMDASPTPTPNLS